MADTLIQILTTIVLKAMVLYVYVLFSFGIKSLLKTYNSMLGPFDHLVQQTIRMNHKKGLNSIVAANIWYHLEQASDGALILFPL